VLELTFHIDKILSDSNQTLAIRIQQTERRNGDLNSDHKPIAQLHANLFKNICKTEELPLVSLLIQEELKYQKKLKSNHLNEQSILFNLIHIPYNQTLNALKLLAGTGKLFFANRQLVVDFFSPVEFYYLVENSSDKNVKVSGKLKMRDQDFDIRACDMICTGSQPWFIKGYLLKMIQTDVSWNELKQAYSPDFNLSLEQIKEMQDDLQSADAAQFPKIVFAGNSLEVIAIQRDPLPILMLKDRLGAFADLWMDYGDELKVSFHEHTTELKDKSQKRISKRLIAAEQAWEKDLLETDFMRKLSETANYYCPVNKVAKSLSFLLELGWKIIDAKGNQVLHQNTIQLSVKSNQQTLLVQGKVKYALYEADISEVAGCFNRRENFVQLGVGAVGLLPTSWEQTGLSSMLAEGELVSDGIKVTQNRFGILSDLFESTSNHHLELDASVLELRNELKSLQGLTPIEENTLFPNKRFQGELRPYQHEGLQWLAFLYRYHFHGILADDMGLGKTVQVLAFLSQLEEDAPILIVLPTSLLFNWQREIERFLPNKAVYLHHGPLRTQNEKQLHRHQIILTSYTTLRLDLPYFSKGVYQCVILDEAQAIKNAHTQSAQAVFSLNARFRLSLTGTPIENSLNELWAHFRFLMPDLLGTEQEFTAHLQASNADARYLQRIKKKIRPFILRRKKEEVAKDLPECIEQTVWIEMAPEQKKIYEEFLAGFKGNLFKKVEVDGMAKHRMEVFEAILRLRQICCHPLLAISQQADSTVCESSKMDALLLDLETVIAEGRKALVYSQFTSMLSLLKKAIHERGWNYAYLDGSTKDREKVVTQFQEDPAIPLFLISLKAGGVGLNLTAADYVFLYDPWWNEAIENQAISRAHRIGRRDVVIAKRYVVIESIEEKIMKLKAAKRSLIDDVLEGEERANLNLTEEDFRFLFS